MTKELMIIPAYNEEGSIIKTTKSIEEFKNKFRLR